MNVFWLDEDPRSPRATLRSTREQAAARGRAGPLYGGRENGLEANFLYQPTHTAHPVTAWVTESRTNWLRLREHAQALNAEFVDRYGKADDHASWQVIERIDPDAIDFPAAEPTPRPQAMLDEYERPGDPVAAYRAYYAGEKADWAEWNYTEEPPWLADRVAALE